MTWVNKVLCVPTVGLTFKPWFRSREGLLSSLSPLLAKWDELGDGLLFQEAGPMALRVESTSGFYFHLDLNRLVVSGAPTVEQQVDSAGAPQQAAVEVAPYSDVLSSVCEIAGDVADCAFGDGLRSLRRVGVIADCQVDHGSPPPGVRLWLEQLSSHWTGGLVGISGQFTAALGSGEGFKDRCHHKLAWKQEGQEHFEFRMDWQRLFDPSPDLRGRDLRKRLKDLCAPALDYFERFGAGLLPEEAGE